MWFFQLSTAYCGSKKSIYIHVCVHSACVVEHFVGDLCSRFKPLSSPSLFFSLCVLLSHSLFLFEWSNRYTLTIKQSSIPDIDCRCSGAPLIPESVLACTDIQPHWPVPALLTSFAFGKQFPWSVSPNKVGELKDFSVMLSIFSALFQSLSSPCVFFSRIIVPECCLLVERIKKWRTTTARVHFR